MKLLLVLDATTGQNALSQAKLFGDKTGLTGLSTYQAGWNSQRRNRRGDPSRAVICRSNSSVLVRKWMICSRLILSSLFMHYLVNGWLK